MFLDGTKLMESFALQIYGGLFAEDSCWYRCVLDNRVTAGKVIAY